MKTTITLLFVIFFYFLSSAQVIQWRGPNRDGHFPDTLLLQNWPEEGPSLIFEVEDAGKGYSSPIIENDIVYISGMIDTITFISSYNLMGELKWRVPCGRAWNKSFPDTRSTPVIDGDYIYFQTGMGKILCFNKTDGQEIWSVDVDTKYETQYHYWGNSETPLIIDDLVIVSPAGDSTSIVALNKQTGEEVWKSKSLGGPRSYASATIYEFNGHRFVLAIIGTHIMALKPENGEIAWTYRYHDPEKWSQPGLIYANTPLCKDNQIFISQGYNYKAVMLEMDSLGTGVTEKFVDQTLDNHHHGMILHDGFIYGSNWRTNKDGRWVCMNWDSGEIMYVEKWESKGSIVMADGLLYCYNERGSVGIVNPDPSGFEVISQFKIRKGSGPHWAHPTIGEGKLLIRHGNALMVYHISQ